MKKLLFVLVGCIVNTVTSTALSTSSLTEHGTPSCYKLRPQEHSEAVIDVCFSDDASSENILSVDFSMESDKNWQMESAFLWIGSNITDLPSDSRGAPLLDLYPFKQERLESNVTNFRLLLAEDLGFVCPREGSRFLVAVHARARHAQTNETIHFFKVNTDAEEESLLDSIIPLVLSCPAEDATLQVSAHQQRRDQECPGLYPNPDKIVLNLTKSFMDKVKVTIDLAAIVNSEVAGPMDDDLIEEQRKIYAFFDGWRDFIDQALVAKTKDTNICWAMFQAVDCANPFDQWQNINPFTTRVGSTNCIVRKGFFSAYKAKYFDEFRKGLDACIATCDGGCPLVLGGHSQGGAAAVVASIDLAHYNPTVITFGAPRTIVKKGPCDVIDSSRHFRFLNTGDNKYDYVPFQINVFNERHVGIPMFLDDFNFPLSTPGLEDNKARQPCSLALHEREIYLERVDGMVNGNCFPIPVSRWPEGHYCKYDDECINSYCEKGQCKVGLR